MPKTPKPRQARSSPRCNKCHNRPLRSECMHTSSGRVYLQQLRSSPETLPSSQTESTDFPLDLAGLMSEQLPLSSQPLPDGEMTAQAMEQPPMCAIDPTLRGDLHTLDDHRNLLSLSSAPHTPHTPSPFRDDSVDPFADLQLDTPIRSAATTHGVGTLPGTQLQLDTPLSSPVRGRPTVANPIYGVVEGAKQGNNVLEILRTKRLPRFVPKSRESGSRFHRAIKAVIVRCEQIAAETNAWIFVGAQHVNATTGLISYSSPRLRRDAKSELAKLQNQYNALVAALIVSRRRDAADLALELGVTNKKNEEIEAESKRLQSEAEKTIQAQDKIIAELQAIVGKKA